GIGAGHCRPRDWPTRQLCRHWPEHGQPSGPAGASRRRKFPASDQRVTRMSTLHIAAEIGSIAPTVLLPGDPLRARHIATMFLDDCREVSARRNMLAFTGSYRGMPVTVMGSGMGIPSCAIYA